MRFRNIVYTMMKKVNNIAEKNKYNRYIKRHPVEKMFSILLFHQYMGLQNGRSLLLQLKYMLGIDTQSLPSQGELSKKLSYRLPVALWKQMFEICVNECGKRQNKKIRKIKQLLRIIDSSHLIATDSMKWAKHRKHKNGLKLHLVLNGGNIPQCFQLKNGNSSDRKSLKWAIQKGYTYIFDRGYNDYRMFNWIGQRGAYFITRAWSNIQYRMIRKRKVGGRQRDKGIVSDSIVEVYQDRKTGEKAIFRMIVFTFVDTNKRQQTFTLLTNIYDVRSDEIAGLYRERWNIEIAFYWIKTFLKVNHWLSRTRNGVIIQLYSALISYLLVLIARMSNATPVRVLRDYVYPYSQLFIHIIFNTKIYKHSENILQFSG